MGRRDRAQGGHVEHEAKKPETETRTPEVMRRADGESPYWTVWGETALSLWPLLTVLLSASSGVLGSLVAIG